MLPRGSRGGSPRDGYTGLPCCTKPAWGTGMVSLFSLSHAGTQGERAFRTFYKACKLSTMQVEISTPMMTPSARFKCGLGVEDMPLGPDQQD